MRRASPFRARLALSRVSLPTLICAMLLALPARAEGWLYEGFLGVGSGLEGGNAGTNQLSWQLARLRLSTGVDFRSDEDPVQGFGVRGVFELQKRGSIGAEVRYSRWLSNVFGGYAGVCGTIVPETLVGATVGGTLRLPFGKRGGLFIEPSFSALPLGSDLPSGSVLFWGLLTVGVNVNL
jgi:hypothetical protein